MITCTILYPAYGRRYATREQALADFEIGRDFRLGIDGPYCSYRELSTYPNILDTYYFYTDEGIV